MAEVTEHMWRSLDWCYVLYAVSTQLAAELHRPWLIRTITSIYDNFDKGKRRTKIHVVSEPSASGQLATAQDPG